MNVGAITIVGAVCSLLLAAFVLPIHGQTGTECWFGPAEFRIPEAKLDELADALGADAAQGEALWNALLAESQDPNTPPKMIKVYATTGPNCAP